MFFCELNETEIDDQLNHCAIAEGRGRSAYPGRSYEQGVAAAIHWMQGDDDIPPIEPDDFFTED